MKKLMLILVIGALSFILFSCPDKDTDPDNPPLDPIDEIGVIKKTFWAQNFSTKGYYQLEAGMLASGTNCTVWVERGAGISKDTAIKVANEFDSNIYQKMINAFGVDINTQEYGTKNPVKLADAVTDNDGKLCILLLDIKDSYVPGVNESAVGGYFSPDDLFQAGNSNKCDMIYIDTYPGRPGEAASNKTLAHELQHLMNEITSEFERSSGNTYTPMDLWIDEGLSTAAEWVYLNGQHPNDRLGWYNNNGNGTNIKGDIDKGNNFYVWGNRTNPYAEIDDYATAYLFFQWLRIQSNNGTAIYKYIIGSTDADYKAVTGAAASEISTDYNNNNWSLLLRDWLAANYINATSTSSRYGYKNNLTLSKHHLTATGTSADLYPGEGVFSKVESSYDVPTGNGNINYSLLTSSGISESPITSGALLTYNVNTTNSLSTPSAPGIVIAAASVSVDASVDGRFVPPPAALSGPFWVSGGDVLRRNGNLTGSSSGVTRSLNRVAR
jgi:hypothetical protein